MRSLCPESAFWRSRGKSLPLRQFINMPERESNVPPQSVLLPGTETMSESERRDYILARIQTSEGGNPTIKAAREIGVPESELREYVFRLLEKDTREGYGLDTILSIAKNSGVAVTPEEVTALFKKTQAEMVAKNPSDETPEKKAQREAAWLEEMLKLCGR